MKSGARALGVAFSDGSERSTLAGALVRADRALSGLAFASCAVGGTDATDAVLRCFDELGRQDVRLLLVAGVAPAWFNVLDLRRLHDAVERPVLSVSFEASGGLEPALCEQFSGDALAHRLAVYDRQPPRTRVELDGDSGAAGDGRTLWVRSVGATDAEARETLAALTPDGAARPEPLRVASVAAAAGRAYRERESGNGAGGDRKG
ncbi:endonuclease dU [Candidatus Halobonum tyrrellensis]|uniref:Uncharacterized protein n=1 Tax=Candidatus Halobonum tyrrellensis G22 TaxID=1324957 RepID=V4HAG0_9EURY|nr:DUF99 family protein [Candidatus Halobonum tyrrellensis]ESP87695.1 hypothetical protein K933_12780 [Candidatus Halobonum tyrrellensis G22]